MIDLVKIISEKENWWTGLDWFEEVKWLSRISAKIRTYYVYFYLYILGEIQVWSVTGST